MATKRRRSTDTNAQWEAVENAVRPALPALTAMDNYRDLYAWAVENGFNTKTLFPKLKRTWRKYDIDYEEMREAGRQTAAAELAAAADGAPLVVLWCYADPEHDVYAVCGGPEGEHAWYGEFHQDSRYYETEQTQLDADFDAADKAIYLAGRVGEHLQVPVVRLQLRTFNHELDPSRLTRTALHNKVALTVEVIDNANPATDWAMAPGFASWRDINLDQLVTADVAA
ncbi:MAG: hypothetical protein WAW85_16865 [Gordonia sp. (in: high G+C Gram-positive bacteria)]|uniref:hypothetical protein n=1 Tax=Gordonia sp. (in: high G+C Gram-positive bacteria) TaxID=84139 RepID=UPI003BB5A8A8